MSDEKKSCLQKIQHEYNQLRAEKKFAVNGFVSGALVSLIAYSISIPLTNHLYETPLSTDERRAFAFFSLAGTVVATIGGGLTAKLMRFFPCSRELVESWDPPLTAEEQLARAEAELASMDPNQIVTVEDFAEEDIESQPLTHRG